MNAGSHGEQGDGGRPKAGMPTACTSATTHSSSSSISSSSDGDETTMQTHTRVVTSPAYAKAFLTR